MTEPRTNQDAARDVAGSPSKLVRYPADHVLGVVDTPEQLIAAVAALRDARFLDSEIDVWRGQAAADALDASTGRTGLAHLVIRVAERLGASNDEMAMKERYEQALRDGGFVVAVFAPTSERTELAAQTLREHDGHFINWMGRFTIEPLHPERR